MLLIAFLIILFIFWSRIVKINKDQPLLLKKIKVGIIILFGLILVLPFFYSRLDSIGVKLKAYGYVMVDDPKFSANDGWNFITDEKEKKAAEDKFSSNLPNVNFDKDVMYLGFGRKINEINFSLFTKIDNWGDRRNPISVKLGKDYSPDRIFIYSADNHILPRQQGGSTIHER